ncbi:ribonuclease III [Mycoplasma haemofelis str. Langford 1]|uniref:Ribonuclease 3 n=1 Tax=Mycoplasma haemofelis (strain Langford 1) TaxID=941640 RepID=E8ZGH5_MYCHL|nr:ribonuclease III domain-containing protein [Mycoplasma haemofelis]CBY92045.1 ribonuclease III [Mycoplasma haemofelis str. Langford 1]
MVSKLSLEEFLNKSFGLTIKDKNLFTKAFTHSSYKGCNPNFKGDYEKLEFLGDSVIGLSIASELFKRDISLGAISTSKDQIVSGSSLAYVGRKLDFHNYIRVGNSCCVISDSIIEDVYEAFIGAVYCEFGFETARKIVLSSLWNYFLMGELDFYFDYKTKLNTLVGQKYKGKVTYTLIDSFPSKDGSTTFKVSASWNNDSLSIGLGTTLKKAEQAAAQDALNTYFPKYK